MGAHGLGSLASAIPIGGTLALVAVVIVGFVALALARRAQRGHEPLFPELSTADADPVAFTERLAAAGNVEDDAAEFTDTAARDGFQQAYALLALAGGDRRQAPPHPDPPRLAHGFDALAHLDEAHDDDRRLEQLLTAAADPDDDPTDAPDPDAPIPTPVPDAPATASVPRERSVGHAARADDDLLPERRSRRHLPAA